MRRKDSSLSVVRTDWIGCHCWCWHLSQQLWYFTYVSFGCLAPHSSFLLLLVSLFVALYQHDILLFCLFCYGVPGGYGPLISHLCSCALLLSLFDIPGTAISRYLGVIGSSYHHILCFPPSSRQTSHAVLLIVFVICCFSSLKCDGAKNTIGSNATNTEAREANLETGGGATGALVTIMKCEWNRTKGRE